MATEVISSTVTPEMIDAIITALLGRFTWLTRLIQAIGILFLIYLIGLLINLYSKFRSRRRLMTIESKLDSIDKKLDKLLKKRK